MDRHAHQLEPGILSEYRKHDITSTEVASLFGCGYHSKFALWHAKKTGVPIQSDKTERMRWGTRLQEAIAYEVSEEQGWIFLLPYSVYLRIPDLRIGSSFDYEAHDADGTFIVEVKNVDSLQFKKSWITDDEGNLEAPPHIELQCQHQLLVSESERLCLVALVGGNTLKLTWRKKNKIVHDAILRECKTFWKSIETNIPPEPDFAKDSESIIKMYQSVCDGKELDARSDPRINELLRLHDEASKSEREAKLQKEATRAELIMLAGDHARIIADGFRVTSKTVAARKVAAYTSPEYRSFKITKID